MSFIFSKKEISIIKDRYKGILSDKTGQFSSRIKPKIKEIFFWFDKREYLNKILNKKSENEKK